MTVLLVDDEVQLRSYLRTLVDWEGHGYRFLEAENGARAIEVMKCEQIHLLMLDITMPVMTGLEVMEWVNENQYNCVAAVLTSHDEFGYVQTALRLGCVDYILKGDITGESILELAGNMQRKLSEELQQQQRQTAAEIAAQRQKLMEERNIVSFWLKNGGAGAMDIIRHFEEQLGFADTDSRYVLLEIIIRDYAEVVNRYSGSNIVQFSVVFDNVLNELFEGYSFFYAECDPGDFLVFLRFDRRETTHNLLGRGHALTRRIDDSFKNLLGIRSGIAFTLPFLAVSTAAELYDRLKQLRPFSFWNPAEEVLCLNDFLFDEHIISEELSVFQREFSQELSSRNLHRISSKYDEMSEKIIGRRYCVRPEVFKNACEACVAALIEPDAIPDVSSLLAHGDCASFKDALLEIAAPYCISEEDQDKKLLVKKALLLIQQHFQEEIGLDWLASRLLVNTSYLSRVFSAEVGQPLTAYIQTYRIEQAKTLIRTTNLKLYEIAGKVGFLSQIVFSSTFKKITGETPTEYKSRNI